MHLISIILPYYNKKEYIKQTLLSIFNQTYKNFEVIIIYDDSLKNDLQYIKKIVRLNKKVILLTNKKNLGAGYSRNKGIKYSKGDYIAFLDADDLWDRKKLALQINFMKKNKISFSHTSYKIINEKNNLLGVQTAEKYISYYNLLKSCDIGLSTVVLKKDIMKKNNFPNLKTKEDYVLWLKLAKKNKIYGLKKNLSSWRRSENSLSGSFFQKILDAFRVYYKYENFNFFISILRVLVLSNFYLFKRIKQKFI
jgi:teichuronic acid biosynthesis glycosyltransferase TuaG